MGLMAVLKRPQDNVSETAALQKYHVLLIRSNMAGANWRFAFGDDWRLAVGGWHLVAVGGDRRRLAVGGWHQ